MKKQVDLITAVTIQMDVVPEIRNNRVCLPARYVAEGFGYQVKWDEKNKAILVMLVAIM